MMEEIAKRVCMENEKKVRARERLAVVDTILEVLKGGGREVTVFFLRVPLGGASTASSENLKARASFLPLYYYY